MLAAAAATALASAESQPSLAPGSVLQADGSVLQADGSVLPQSVGSARQQGQVEPEQQRQGGRQWPAEMRRSPSAAERCCSRPD